MVLKRCLDWWRSSPAIPRAWQSPRTRILGRLSRSFLLIFCNVENWVHSLAFIPSGFWSSPGCWIPFTIVGIFLSFPYWVAALLLVEVVWILCLRCDSKSFRTASLSCSLCSGVYLFHVASCWLVVGDVFRLFLLVLFEVYLVYLAGTILHSVELAYLRVSCLETQLLSHSLFEGTFVSNSSCNMSMIFLADSSSSSIWWSWDSYALHFTQLYSLTVSCIGDKRESETLVVPTSSAIL